MQRSSAFADQGTIERARRALGRRHNWLQLAKFCAVGASGYLVNLAVFTILVGSGLHYLLAATGSFLVAVTNNYIWNRLWTFRGQRGHVAYQGLRFLVVSGGLALRQPRHPPRARPGDGLGRCSAGDRDRAGHPAELRREQALVVRAALAALVAGLALAAPAAAATTPSGTVSEPVYDEDGRLVQTPFVPSSAAARLTEDAGDRTSCCATRRSPTGSIDTRPSRRPTPSIGPRPTSGSSRPGRETRDRSCSARSTTTPARVNEAWTGPQVAWSMARGGAGAFGGKTINGMWLWLAFCALFLVGLADLRQASLAAQPRPARAALVLDLAPALQRGRDLLERPARLSAARLPARPLHLDRAPRPAAARPRAGLAGLAARRRRRLPRPGSGSG